MSLSKAQRGAKLPWLVSSCIGTCGWKKSPGTSQFRQTGTLVEAAAWGQ